MKPISSRDNPRFKRLRRWATQARSRREDGVILLDGLHLIDALLAADGALSEIYVSESGARRAENRAWLAACPLPEVLLLGDGMFAEVAATETPSGILGVGSFVRSPAAPDLACDCVLLDGVQDPGNVGTLLRTAAAAGIRQALLGAGCADPWATKSLRAGQGAQFELAIHESCDLLAFLAGFQGTSIVTRLDADRSLYDTPLDGALAWVFGAEGRGVSPSLAAAAKTGVFIPMPGRVESLNVAAAAAICLFEAVRRRRS